MPTNIFGIAALILGALLAIGTLIFFMGVMSDQAMVWRKDKMAVGGAIASVSGILLIFILLVFNV